MVPLETKEELRSRISEHFGRAPYFALIELGDRDVKVEIIENPRNLGYTPGQYVVAKGVECVVIKGDIGIKALQILREHGIKIIETSKLVLEDIIEELRSGKLREYKGKGCPGGRQ